MSVDQIKSLTRLGASKRTLNWKDYRSKSPKDIGDMSGIMLSRPGNSVAGYGVQDFDYDMIAKINVCNDMAWTCIELISSTAALGKLKVRRQVGNNVEYLPDHPLQKILDSPNATMTQFDLIQAYVTNQQLFGTVAMLLLRGNMTQACPVCLEDGTDDCLHRLYYYNTGQIEQIMPIHPANLIQDFLVINGVRRKVFFYVPEPNRKFPIHPDNILTDPFYNVDSNRSGGSAWYGVSPTFLLKRWLDLDSSMTSQVKALFDNGSIPSMIINMKPGNNFTYEQEPETLMSMMKEKWLAQFSASGKGLKTPAFVYGDVNVQRLQDNINESVAKGLYYEIENRVCATYGVPHDLYEMGIRYGPRAGTGVQLEKDFYNRTMSKIFTRLELKINKMVVPSFNTPGLEVVWDLSEVGIADFLIQSKKDAVKKDWELGLITRDEARLKLAYTAVGGEFGNDFYRLTVMSDGTNQAQASGMDNRLKQPKPASTEITSTGNEQAQGN